MIAHNPLHGSGRAALPHAALALGNKAQATQGIGMTDRRQWQSMVDEAPHALPQKAAVLAAPRQRAIPEPPHLCVADPLSYDFFIHYTSPVLAGAQGEKSCSAKHPRF